MPGCAASTAVRADAPGRIGAVSFSVLGSGSPVSVFAHGLGGSATEVRPLASRSPGTRVLLSFRGHGDSGDLPDGWDYDLLADDLLGVADAVGATRAVGLSVGAGALLRALTRDPDRFERLAFVLPAALDETREDGATVSLTGLADAIDAQDLDGVVERLLADVPDAVRDRRGVRALVERRARGLVARPAPRPLHHDRPVHDRGELAAVRAPALVVGQDDDPLHTLDLAVELSAALPNAALLALPTGGVFWTATRQVQDALADHLAED
jgi:pimeloyl-ACP methyl ester carboxylesterase